MTDSTDALPPAAGAAVLPAISGAGSVISHPQAVTPAIASALVASRQHWRDLAEIAFDLSYETDATGRFVLLAPEQAFGWPTPQLLGHPADELLCRQDDRFRFNPLRPGTAVRGHRTWIRRADGSQATVLVSSAPIHDGAGALVGARGAIQDISAQEERERLLAESLLCQQTMNEIGRRMRRAVLPDMVIMIGLEELLDATGSSGALIIACEQQIPGTATTDPTARTAVASRILHRAGRSPPVPDQALVDCAMDATTGTTAPWTRTVAQAGCRLMLSAAATRFCDPVVLMLWRETDRDWIDGDPRLVAAFMAALAGTLEHDRVQRELARQSGADTLTGLLNRDSFTAEVNRRLDRLDAEKLAATLMVVGLDRFHEINQKRGHEQGDVVLRHAARTLRDAVRPTDLAARLGGDVFALWLDGADQFAAAERAESLCQQGVALSFGTPEDQVTLRVSVGLATRPSRSAETIDGLLEQAHAALGAIKLAGGGRWHFYNEGTAA